MRAVACFLTRWSLRGLALLLALICFQRAWAGAGMYQGGRALLQDLPEQGYESLIRVAPVYRYHPVWQYRIGEACLKRFEKSGDLTQAACAERYLTEAVEGMPFSGRLRALAIEARIRHGESVSPTGLTDAAKRDLFEDIQDAFDAEPGNGWMALRTGMMILENELYTSAAEKKVAVEALARAVEIHEETFMAPALRFLWWQARDVRLIEQVVPTDFEAYERYLSFIEGEGLWSLWPKAYLDYQKIRDGFYAEACERGEKALEAGKFRKAFLSFQQAWWADDKKHRARLGMLLSHEGAGEPLSWDSERVVTDAFEDEDALDEIRGLFPFMDEFVREKTDAYGKGVYAYFRGDSKTASDQLRKAGHVKASLRQRLLASALDHEGNRTEALRVLFPIRLEEDPDLRDLTLLMEITEGEMFTTAESLLIKHMTRERPARAWRWKGQTQQVLQGKMRAGQVVNLRPGKVRFVIPVRSGKQESEEGVLVFRLGDRVIGAEHVWRRNWRIVTLDVETTGGRRWLNVEQIRSKDSGEVELGGLKVLISSS